MGNHSRLSKGDRWWLGLAVVFAVAVMLAGFWLSFWNLSAAAQRHHWHNPNLLPLMIDLAVPTYVIVDHLIVRLGWRSLLPRAAVWGAATLTIVLNGGVIDASPLWRIAAMAGPAAWVLGIEVLRVVWRASQKTPATRPEPIPLGRWLADPWPTLKLWRRKHQLGVTSWPLMCALDDARIYLRDVVTAVTDRYPDRPVPLAVRRAVTSGRFPGDLSERIRTSLEYGGASLWEPDVDKWVASRMRLPETITEAISAPIPEVVPVPVPSAHGSTPETPVVTAHETPLVTGSRDRTKKPPKPAPRKMTDDELMPYVRDLLAAEPGASLGAVRRATGTGPERARKLLDRGKAEHPHIAAVN